MINVSGMGIGLRRADAARRAVVTADATGSVLGEINIVGQENGEGVRLNSEIGDESMELRIEPVDVHQPRVKPEHDAGFTILDGRTQCLFRQYGRASQPQVVPSMILHRAPEIGTLISVNVLSRAHTYAPGSEGNG